MNELLSFKIGAIGSGLCSTYRHKWDAAEDRRQLMDIALDAKGIDFIADTTARETWGLSPEFILGKFGDYVNGKYQRDKDGYTSEMYVLFTDDLTPRSTITLLIGCACDVYVGKNSVRQIYVSKGTSIRVHCDGECVIVKYGEDCSVSVDGLGKAHIISKKDRDHDFDE